MERGGQSEGREEGWREENESRKGKSEGRREMERGEESKVKKGGREGERKAIVKKGEEQGRM